jgi:hypothetical protein
VEFAPLAHQLALFLLDDPARSIIVYIFITIGVAVSNAKKVTNLVENKKI